MIKNLKIPIKAKIIVILLLAVFIPFSIVRYLTYLDIRQTIQNEVLQNLNSIVTLQDDRVEEEIAKNNEELSIAEGGITLNTNLYTYNKTKSTVALNAITTMLTTSLQAKFPTFKKISILNLQGDVLSSTDPTQIGQNEYTNKVFKVGEQANNTSMMYKAKVGDVRFYLTGPLVYQGQTDGVIIIEKSASDLFSLFNYFNGLGTTFSWGLVTHSPNGDTLLIVPGRSIHDPNAALTKTISKNETNTPANLALHGNNKTYPDLVNYLGVHVIAATRYIPVNDWGLGVTINEDEAYAPLNQITNDALFFGFLLFLFTILFGSFFADFLTIPVIKLSKSIQKVAKGDLSVRTHVQSRDEMQDLANNFNSMAAKLEEADRKEKQLDKTKDDFLSIAAHQLRTPLGNMRWNLERLIDREGEGVTEKGKEIISDLNTSTIRLISLANALLDASRINQDRVDDHPEEVNIGEIIQDVVKNYEHELELKSVHISIVGLDTPLSKVFIDPHLFYQVIVNLLSNAIKYNKPDGNIEIKVENNPSEIVIHIKDTGIGIPQDAQDRVFDKFFRATNAANTKNEGTGIGLFIVKSYIEKWHGRIWFDSKENEGTTFHIMIPK
jgi:signal transduction histidine kinase